ncbi:MAG: penicillin-binding protein activator, partial [Spongiibacteraceae bacterium]
MKTRTFAVLLCSSLFAACATPPDVSRSPELGKPRAAVRRAPPRDDSERFNAATADTAMVEEWIATAALSDPATAAELLLRAAEVQLRDGMIDVAEETVRELIAPELTGEQAVRLAIIRARVFRAHAAFTDALAQLRDPIVEAAIVDLPLQLQLHFSQLRASLFAIEGKHLAAAQEWIYIYPLLRQSQQPQTRGIIWASLMEVPTSTLLEHFNSADNRDYLGWLELASIAKDNQGDIEAQVHQRNSWLTRWAQHPAAGNLPGGLDKLEKLVIERPDRIALILPVTGRLAAYGKAIRDGFIAAYYDAYGSQGHV